MRLGVHLPNGDVTARDWADLERLRPTAVTTMQRHHGAAVYERLEAISRPLYLVRVDPEPGAVALAWASVPQAIRQSGRVLLRFGNEPNTEGLTAAEYTRRFLAVKAAVRVPLLVANLSLCEGWQEYLRGIEPAIRASDGIGLSLYRDDASDPGRWLNEYGRFGKPLYGVELNVDYEPHGERRVGWWKWAVGNLQPHIEAATVFILGGKSNGAWRDDYIMTAADVEGLARLIGQQEEEAVTQVDYPGAVWVGSPNFAVGRGGRQVVAVVDHITAGSAQAVNNWFRNVKALVSSHYVVRRDGVVEQYVREEDTAWANGIDFDRGYNAYRSDRTVEWLGRCWRDCTNPNRECVSIEHEAVAGQGLTEAQYRASLELHRYLIERHGLPADRQHLVGHYQIDGVNKLGCPGPLFPWARLLEELKPAVPQSVRDAAEGHLHALWGLDERTHRGVIAIKQDLQFE